MQTDYEAIGKELMEAGIRLEAAGHSRENIIDGMFVTCLTGAHRLMGPRFVACYLRELAGRFEAEADRQEGRSRQVTH